MRLKAGKKKKHVLHAREKKLKEREGNPFFVSCGLVFWFPSGSDTYLHLNRCVLLLSSNNVCQNDMYYLENLKEVGNMDTSKKSSK